MEAGDILRIKATNPGSVKDFEPYTKQTDNRLLSSTEVEGEFPFTLKD